MKIIFLALLVLGVLPAYGEYPHLRRQIVKNCKAADGSVHEITLRQFSDGDRSMTVDGKDPTDFEYDEAYFAGDGVVDGEGIVRFTDCELVSDESFRGGRDDAGG